MADRKRKRGPSEPQLPGIEAKAREIGGIIGAQMPAGVGFCLMLFTFGEGGWSTYLSNADRETMVTGIKELLTNLED